jgi:mannose-6-phosphate isomerase-like protein (cupin superfamily)|tara:strand:- start:533 stop:1081 length:549 start_codon:yes stop_codon:yes gene_type:complete
MIDLTKLQNIVDSTNINLTESDVLNFLKNRKRWPFKYPWNQPTVEILSNAGNLQSDYLFDADSYLNFSKWEELYNLGYTSVVSNILDLSDDLRILQKKLFLETGLNITANFYFSKPGQQASFDAHKHSYDVIVKQIYGESTWSINNKVFILQSQKSCIVPKNSLHQVLDKNVKKLSLTINIE